MHHAKAFHTYKTMQMIFSLHDMHDKAAMWKQHTRTKEINTFKPSPCKALKNALPLRFLHKEDRLCLAFSSLLPPLGLPTKLLLTTISQGRARLKIFFIRPAEIWLSNEDLQLLHTKTPNCAFVQCNRSVHFSLKSFPLHLF